jgi:hypothetical protein
VDLTPSLILSLWTAGIAIGSALVARWAIVGPGFSWLSGGVLVLSGGAAAAAGAGTFGWLAVVCAFGGALAARRRNPSALLFAASGLLMLVAGFADSPVVPALSGALVLGGITSEMLLGHWYLVDPQLPRWALQALAIGSGAALLVDVAYLIIEGALDWGAGDEVLGWAFVVLSAMTALLVTAVSLALREPFYTAVMAATGLSYLAVLTSFGAVVLGRLLAF